MTKQCAVCGEEGESINWHYGAITCFACTKFFYRSETQHRRTYTCSGSVSNNCKITTKNRVCQYCRYQKCLSSGMNLNLKSQNLSSNDLIKSTACAVCSEPSSGIHFGVTTCEACKGFFQRNVNQKSTQPRKCTNATANSTGICEINKKTRSNCRFCRLAKCISVGMSTDLIHLGRQTNIFKHDVMENSRYSMPKKQKASLKSSANQLEQEMGRKPKRAKLLIDNSAKSLDLSDTTTSSLSSSSSSSTSTNFNSPLSNQRKSFEVPYCIHSITNHPEIDVLQNVTQPNQYVTNQIPYSYPAYDHFSQYYSRKYFDNINYGMVNEQGYATTAYSSGNQFNYYSQLPAQYNQYADSNDRN